MTYTSVSVSSAGNLILIITTNTIMTTTTRLLILYIKESLLIITVSSPLSVPEDRLTEYTKDRITIITSHLNHSLEGAAALHRAWEMVLD